MSFYSSIAPYYDLIFPFDEKLMAFLEAVLDPVKHPIAGVRNGEESVASRGFLDIGCGTGTVLSEFTDRFHKLAGIDLDEELLKLATEKMYPGEDKKVELFNDDVMEMKNLLREDQFSFITCLGNTVPHLKNPGQIPLLFKQVYDSLETGGVFVFQIINYDRILDNDIRGLPTIEKGEVTFERYYSAVKTDGLLDFDTTLCDPERGLEVKNTVQLYPVRKAQLTQFLQEAGFTKYDFYGDLNGSSLKEDSVLLIGVCTK